MQDRTNDLQRTQLPRTRVNRGRNRGSDAPKPEGQLYRRSFRTPQANTGASSDSAECRSTYLGPPDLSLFSCTSSSRAEAEALPSAEEVRPTGCSMLPGGSSGTTCSSPPCSCSCSC